MQPGCVGSPRNPNSITEADETKLVWTLIFPLAPLALAQGLGTIVGTVTDPSGAAIPSARVTATETPTSLSRSFATNAQVLRLRIRSLTVAAL